MKASFIVSAFPFIGALTFFIYPFVMGIVIAANCEEFENKGLAIATGILNIFLLPILLFVPFIMGFFLKEKAQINKQ